MNQRNIRKKKEAGIVEMPASNLKLYMTPEVLETIWATIGQQHAERGGALGGDRRTGLITHYRFDDSARRTGVTYSPDHVSLNRLFEEEWYPNGINLLGFVHSHPQGIKRPSPGDLLYARRILKAIPDLQRLDLPIVQTVPDTGKFEIFGYSVIRDGDDVILKDLEIVLLAGKLPLPTNTVIESLNNSSSQRHQSEEGNAAFTEEGYLETFRQVQDAYDLDHLARCNVICVGTGGAASFIEELARAGVGRFVLIDPDKVSEPNIATQQVYRKDIGRNKVDCVAERIADINPNASVIALPLGIEEIDDEEFKRLCRSPVTNPTPARNLICGFTDNFEAQARINRLALNFGLPSLCAQVYAEGRGAELTFTYPGVTPACQRCALSSRYEAYLHQGFRNDVTSRGTPIFATTRLNAMKGPLAMAILHHGTAHPRWGKLLEQIGNRNLIQIRMDPYIATSLGLTVFNRVFGGGDQARIFFDDVVWLPQLADSPETGFPACPDCGGTVDLLQAVGTFADTRVMRR